MTDSPTNGPTRPAGPSDLALPLTLVRDLMPASVPGRGSARRADEIRTATATATATASASKRRRAGRRKAAVRGWDR